MVSIFADTLIFLWKNLHDLNLDYNHFYIIAYRGYLVCMLLCIYMSKYGILVLEKLEQCKFFKSSKVTFL